MIVIGIMGRIGSGKSEVAKRLIGRHNFERQKFANGLKQMLTTLLMYRGVMPAEVDRYIEGDLKEEPTPYLNGRTPRHAMITLGTEWGRNLIDADIWVDTEVDRLKMLAGSSLNRAPARFVFDDVRFPNELQAIRLLGGSIWKIERPGVVALDHESEMLQATPDRVLDNSGSIGDLIAQVDAFVWGEVTKTRAVA